VIAVFFFTAASALNLAGCEVLFAGQPAELDAIIRQQETAMIALELRAKERVQLLRELERLKQRWREAHGDEPPPQPKPVMRAAPSVVPLPESAPMGLEDKLVAARANRDDLARLQVIVDETEQLAAAIATIKAALPAPPPPSPP
jgi:hypothetical protein